MKTIIKMAIAGLLYCLASLAGCGTLQPSTDPAEAVRAKFEAFNRHDVSAIENIYAADAVLHSPDYPELSGNAPIAGTYRSLFEAVPDAHDETQSLDVVADKVYAQFVLTGHFKGAADKPIKARLIAVYTVHGGRIIEDATYYDRKM